MLFSGQVSLKALTHKLPIKFRVNMPLGEDRGSIVGAGKSRGESSGPGFGCIEGG